MKKIMLIIIIGLSVLLECLTYTEYNPNDERFKILALEKARLRVEKSERDFLNAKSLYDRELISFSEFENFRLQFEYDRINLQQYLLNVIFDLPHISIISALKSQNQQGQVIVDLTLKNTSGSLFSLEEKVLFDEQNYRLSPTTLYNLYVSLQDSEGNIISQPYEYHLASLELDEYKTINFSLLKDLEALTVSINYGDRVSNKRIYLKRGGEESQISITPNIYAQEVESGQVALYNLTLEFFGEGRQRYRLGVADLPSSFSYEFVNIGTNATVSNIVLSSATPKQTYSLRIMIPEKIAENIILDEALTFSAIVETEDGSTAGATTLEIIPTGRTSITLNMNNLYFSYDIKDEIMIKPLSVLNDGMKRITNLSFDIILPSNWEYNLEPERIESLEPNQEVRLSLELRPNQNVIPGIYQVRIRGRGTYVNRTVHTSEREVRIELQSGTNIFLIFLLIVLSLALVAGVIYTVIKINKS